MAEYVGMSLRDIYARKCEEYNCKKNSKLLAELPSRPDYFTALTALDISNNYVGNKGLIPLLEVIRIASALSTLNVSDNQLSNQLVTDVCDVLAHHAGIRSVSFANNPITIAGGQAIVGLLKQNNRITDLLMEGTKVPSLIIRGIEVQLQQNRKLMDDAAGGNSGPKHVATEVVDEDMTRFAARTFLAALPTSVADRLVDENPQEALYTMCVKEKARFIDTQFPPEALTIQRCDAKKYGDRGWKRLPEVYPGTKLLPSVDEPIEWPVLQSGNTTTAWLWTTLLEAVKGNPGLLQVIFGSSEVNPYGFYCIQFVIDGQSRYVIVDDYIPIGANGKSLFSQPLDGVYLWPCILEKAIAKIHGSYQALDRDVSVAHPEEIRVTPATIFADLTGGVGISRDLHAQNFQSNEWWETMLEMHENGAHIIATTNGSSATTKEEFGIATMHAYSVLSVRQINGYRLIRLHSPWTSLTWLGDWSDRSGMWNQYNDIKVALDFRNKADSSFWISYQHFLQHFSTVEIARTFPSSAMHTVLMNGKWDVSSSGGPYFERAWERNPRYRLRLEDQSTVFVQLSLPDTRFYKSDVDTIAFHILATDFFPIRFDKENISAKTSYVVTNSVSFEGTLDAGEHWIVPSAYVPGRWSPFLLRVVSRGSFSLSPEPLNKYWKETSIRTLCESSGMFQCGEDVPQYEVVVPSRTRPARLVVRMATPEKDDLSLGVFVCIGEGNGMRMLGNIPDEIVMTKSKYLTTPSLTFECHLPGSSMPYVVVPTIQPEGTRTPLEMTFWCDEMGFEVKELPLWKAKAASAEWTSSGAYQDTNNNAQFELIPSQPNQTFVVKLDVTDCNDPAITFFVVNNKGRSGVALKGPIPEHKLAAKATYVRGSTVIKEFNVGATPSDSYIIVPCLQPPGAAGKLTLTITSDDEDYQFFQILS